MKNFILLFSMICCFGLVRVEAQIVTPAPSPSSTVKQTVGLTDITIEYSRPGKKDREIFGGLVPYDKMWRTGANAATKVIFSEALKINGTKVEKGEYALFTKPGKTSWEIMLFPYTTRSAGGYGEAEPAVKFMATPKMLSHSVESFRISIENLRNESADMELTWDKVMVPLKIEVNTDEQAMASINKTLGGPTSDDYYNAGMFFVNADKDLNTALGYIQKATRGKDAKFWQLRQEAEVLAKLGKYPDAVEVAKKSLAMAEAAKNENYVRINKENIEMWSKK